MTALPLEQIENVLKTLADRNEKVMVRFFLFGTVELCLFGDIRIEYDIEDSTPFFVVAHKTQYATNIRFYGQDVRLIRSATNGVVELYLAPAPKTIDNFNDLP
jgi:hypothetical protein